MKKVLAGEKPGKEPRLVSNICDVQGPFDVSCMADGIKIQT